MKFKKILFSLLLLAAVIAPQITLVARAADAECSNTTIHSDLAALFPTKFCTANELILFIIKTMLSLIAVVAVGFIIWGGYRYVMSNGEEEAAGAGKRTITNALIGLTIAILSWTIITVAINTVTDRSTPTAATTGNGPGQSTTTGSGNTETNTTPQDPIAQERVANAFSMTADSNNGFIHIFLNPTAADLNSICPLNNALPSVSALMNINGDVNTSIITEYKRVAQDPNGDINTEISTNVHKPIIPDGATDADINIKFDYIYDNGCEVVLQKSINTSNVHFAQ